MTGVCRLFLVQTFANSPVNIWRPEELSPTTQFGEPDVAKQRTLVNDSSGMT